MPDGYSIWFNLVGNLGALGFVFILVWHMMTKQLPKMIRSFQESLKTARDDFRASLNEHKEFYAQQRITDREHMTALINTLNKNILS